MITSTKHFAVLAFAFVLAVSASQASAQTRQNRDRQPYEKALHECMLRAQKAPNSTFGNYNSFVYWACMGEHGYQH